MDGEALSRLDGMYIGPEGIFIAGEKLCGPFRSHARVTGNHIVDGVFRARGDNSPGKPWTEERIAEYHKAYREYEQALAAYNSAQPLVTSVAEVLSRTVRGREQLTKLRAAVFEFGEPPRPPFAYDGLALNFNVIWNTTDVMRDAPAQATISTPQEGTE